MTATSDQGDEAARGASLTGRVQLAAVIAVVIAAIFVNRVVLAGADRPPEIVPAPTAPVVEIIAPTPQRETIEVNETGTVQSRTNISITPQVSGRVLRVAPNFAAGGSFQAGELLFEIDPTDLQLLEQQAEADLAAAMSGLQLEEAEGETARREWRLINGEEPIPALVAREPQIAQAQANVAAARSRLADVREDLARTRFALPFDGRIVRTTIDVGQTVAANQSYGEVYGAGSVEVFVSLTDEALAALEPAIGRSAFVTAAGDRSTRAPATVVRVDAQRDRQTRLAGITLGFEGAPPFVPGVFVDVEIMGEAIDSVLKLPADLVSSNGAVWVVEGSALARRDVTVISRQDEFALVEPFDVGDGVVVTPPPGARAGLAVTVVGPDGSGAAVAGSQ